MPQDTIREWREEYDNTLKRAILRVGDNCPASQYLAESAKEFIEKAIVSSHSQELNEIIEKIEKMKTPAILRNEEIECCNCGEDLALESYDWLDEGYLLAIEDIVALLRTKLEKPLEANQEGDHCKACGADKK